MCIYSNKMIVSMFMVVCFKYEFFSPFHQEQNIIFIYHIYRKQSSTAAMVFGIINWNTHTDKKSFLWLNEQNTAQNQRPNRLKCTHYHEQVLFTALCALLQAKHTPRLMKGGEWGCESTLG